MFFIVILCADIAIRKNNNQTPYIVTDIVNVPFGISILGGILTAILLLLRLQPTTLTLPLLGQFGVVLYLDALSTFFLCLLFFSTAIFLFFKRELAFNNYCLLLYIFLMLLLLAGNILFLVNVLAFFILMISFMSSTKKSSPLLVLFSLFTIVCLLPGYTTHYTDLSSFSFVMVRQSNIVPYIMGLVVLMIWLLLGFFPFGRWKETINQHQQGDFIYSFIHVLMSLVAFYLCIRFWLDIGHKSGSIWGFVCIGMGGLIASCIAGWKSLIVKGLYDRIYALFVLSNGILVQMISVIALCYIENHKEWLPFAYEALFFGIVIQILSFSLAFILVGFSRQKKAASDSFIMIPEILNSLLFLSFLISGFPPLAGFSVLWCDLQFLLSMASGYNLVGTLLVTAAVGLSAFILIFSLLGWLRFILTGGITSLQNAFDHFGQYFSKSIFLEVKISIFMLFILSLFPGIILVFVYSLIIQLSGIDTFTYSIVSFRASGYHIVLTPWFIAALFVLIVAIIGWVAQHGRHKSMLYRNTIINNRSKKNQTLFEETSIHFGQNAFQYMLKDRFSFVQFFVVLYRYIRILFLYRMRKISYCMNNINIIAMKYTGEILLIIIGLVLISIGFVVQ